jgi:hypothetical protein
MTKPIRILLQTTIPAAKDDWSIDRFSILREWLTSFEDEAGNALYAVTARDRAPDWPRDDELLAELDKSDFGELWLFAVDTGSGLSKADCDGITRFRQRDGGLLSARDHQDLGSSLCAVGGVGAAHHFNTRNPEPDQSRRRRDDFYTESISWPNYHSGRNGDYQKITLVEPIHELLRNPSAPGGAIHLFPAHPHEGAVGAPPGDASARVIATGESQCSKRQFNLAVAFERQHDERGNNLGRAVAESSFHHFVDYNLDVERGAPAFVTELPGDGYKREPQALEDIKAYVRNLALWLTPEGRNARDGRHDAKARGVLRENL